MVSACSPRHRDGHHRITPWHFAPFLHKLGRLGREVVFGVFVVYFVTCLAVALSLAPAEGQGHPRRHVHLSTSEMVYILGDEVVCERALYERGKS